jgi:hypothetical protein
MTPRPRNLGETYTLIGRSIRDLEALGVTVPVALLQAYHSLAEHNLRVIAASKAGSPPQGRCKSSTAAS